MLLEVLNVRSGAVLDRFFGRETEDTLEFTLEGLADTEAFVTVDGKPAVRCDRIFRAPVKLTKKINEVCVCSSSQYGEQELKLTLVWDKASYKRYNFFIDDHSFLFTELAKQRPKNICDHFYLAYLKKIHDLYGTKFTLNTFFRNDHDPEHFTLKEMPDCYKQQFQDISDWLKLSFHAYSEFPDRPYQHATAEKLAADYDLVKSEIDRFAGKDTFIPPIVLHWAITNPDNFPVLRQRGVRVLEGSFLAAKTFLGEKETRSRVADIGYFYEKDVANYICAKRSFYDRFQDMFLTKAAFVCNLTPIEEIPVRLQAIFDNPADSPAVCLVSHEQYSFPHYFNYLPDHLQRLELAARTMTEAGYKPVFFAQGLLGNMSWED